MKWKENITRGIIEFFAIFGIVLIGIGFSITTALLLSIGGFTIAVTIKWIMIQVRNRRKQESIITASLFTI